MLPFRPFLYHFPSTTRTMVLAREKLGKKKRCTEIRNIEFDWKQPRQFFIRRYFFCHSSSNSVSIPLCHIKRCCLIPCSQYQPLFLPGFEGKYAWYLHSFPIHLLISLLPVICSELTITRTFFGFPRKFELSGVDYSFKWSKSIIGSNTEGT